MRQSNSNRCETFKGIHRGLVRGMLGSLYGEASTQTESSLPMGDEVCITAVDDH